MMATLSKPSELATVALEDELAAAGYSDKELNLISYCWQDSLEINRSKISLAQHLWQLKQEMDANDPNAGNSPTKSRFWSAFEAGHLPLQGDKGRTSVKTCLQAAQWLASRDLANPLANSFGNLAPATICEISGMPEPAQELVLESVQSCEFIGVAAVRLLAAEKLPEVFERLKAWIAENPKQPITPKTIRAFRAEVEQENQPASEATVTVSSQQADEQNARLQSVLQSIRHEAPARQQQAKVDAVKEELSRPDRERHERLQAKVREYNSKLNAATSSVHELLVFLQSLDRIDGTQFLDDMRSIDVLGLVTVHDDLSRLQKIGEDLMASVTLARSCNPPTGIDMTTIEV